MPWSGLAVDCPRRKSRSHVMLCGESGCRVHACLADCFVVILSRPVIACVGGTLRQCLPWSLGSLGRGSPKHSTWLRASGGVRVDITDCLWLRGRRDARTKAARDAKDSRSWLLHRDNHIISSEPGSDAQCDTRQLWLPLTDGNGPSAVSTAVHRMSFHCAS